MNSGVSASDSPASAHATLSALSLYATGSNTGALARAVVVVPVVALLRGLILIPPGCG
jgi:hypothetical protein